MTKTEQIEQLKKKNTWMIAGMNVGGFLFFPAVITCLISLFFWNVPLMGVASILAGVFYLMNTRLLAKSDELDAQIEELERHPLEALLEIVEPLETRDERLFRVIESIKGRYESTSPIVSQVVAEVSDDLSPSLFQLRQLNYDKANEDLLASVRGVLEDFMEVLELRIKRAFEEDAKEKQDYAALHGDMLKLEKEQIRFYKERTTEIL